MNSDGYDLQRTCQIAYLFHIPSANKCLENLNEQNKDEISDSSINRFFLFSCNELDHIYHHKIKCPGIRCLQEQAVIPL